MASQLEQHPHISPPEVYDAAYVANALTRACAASVVDRARVSQYRQLYETYVLQIESNAQRPSSSLTLRMRLASACRLAVAAFLIADTSEYLESPVLAARYARKLLATALASANEAVGTTALDIPQLTAPILLAVRALKAQEVVDLAIPDGDLLLSRLHDTRRHWSWAYLCGQAVALVLLQGPSRELSCPRQLPRGPLVPACVHAGALSDADNGPTSSFERRVDWLMSRWNVGCAFDARMWLSIDACVARALGNTEQTQESLLHSFHELSPGHFLALGVYFPVVRAALREASGVIVAYEDGRVRVHLREDECARLTNTHEAVLSAGGAELVHDLHDMMSRVDDVTARLLNRIPSATGETTASLLLALDYWLEVLGLTSLRLNRSDLVALNEPIRRQRRCIVDKISERLLQCAEDGYIGSPKAQLLSKLASSDADADMPCTWIKDGTGWRLLGQHHATEFCRRLLSESSIAKEEPFSSTGRVACALPGEFLRGAACVVRSPDDFMKCRSGDVLIVGDFPTSVVGQLRERGISPSAVVSQGGGIGCHAAIECRENRWPCVVEVRGALLGIETGWVVTIRGDAEKAEVVARAPGHV